MSQLRLRVFDGTRQPFPAGHQVLITLTDGHQQQQFRDFRSGNDWTFDLPFFDNAGDQYSVVVWAQGFRQSGFMPVKLSADTPTTVDLMLLPSDASFNFSTAPWSLVSARYPFLRGDVDDATAEARYNNLMEAAKPLASLLNLGEAMTQITLPGGQTPLPYLKQMRWAPPFAPAQDRFFAWCDRALVDQVRQACALGGFAEEKNPGLFHPGATASWKQIDFGEANVQLTFHEQETAQINGVDCVMVEPDIDYYKDLAAHGLFEVVPNALTHSLTNPEEIYVLRWIAGRRANRPEFDPLYTLRG